MSFLDQVHHQVCNMHLPVTSNDVYMAMKDNPSMGILSPAAKRDKIRKALSDLRHKRGVLTAKNDNDGLLWWDLAFYSKPSAVATLPEKLPEPPKEPCPTLVVHKQLLVDIGQAFLKAAADL
jgi:hypothetical protein